MNDKIFPKNIHRFTLQQVSKHDSGKKNKNVWSEDEYSEQEFKPDIEEFNCESKH